MVSTYNKLGLMLLVYFSKAHYCLLSHITLNNSFYHVVNDLLRFNDFNGEVDCHHKVEFNAFKERLSF